MSSYTTQTQHTTNTGLYTGWGSKMVHLVSTTSVVTKLYGLFGN